MTRRFRIITLVAILALSVAGVAAASEHEGEEPSGDTDEELLDSWFWYDSDLMQLTYSLPDPEADPEAVSETEGLARCLPDAKDLDAEAETASEVVEGEAAPLPDGCVTISVVGPSGKVTHGSIVSAFVHSLKDSERYDKSFHGPKGQWVREVAWSDDGKAWSEEGDGDSEATVEATTAKGKKPKKPKKGNGHSR